MQNGHLKQDINTIQVPYHHLHKTKQTEKNKNTEKDYCTSDEKRKVSAKILGNKNRNIIIGKQSLQSK